MITAATLGDALRDLTAAFTMAGLDSPQADARLLVAHALGLDRLMLVTEPQRPLSDHDRRTLSAIATRRLAREPVSRIIGERWFYGRPFKLGPATLDPRPESETLIEAVLQFVRREGLTGAPLRLLDVGTGTGCLLLTLLAELPAASGVGIDIAPNALQVAAANATALGISPTRVSWQAGSGFAPATGIFNIILSNPPYIPKADIAALAPEVRAFDPVAALDGGADGLDFYRAWSRDALIFLHKPLGMLIFEVGHTQAAAVAALMRAAAFDLQPVLEPHQDLARIPRCVAMITRSATPC